MLGMLDSAAGSASKVETDESIEFVLRSDLDKLKQNHTIVSEETIVHGRLDGEFFRPRGARVWLCEVAGAEPRRRWLAVWRCRASAVMEDQSLVGDWRPVILSVEGPITPRKVRQLETLIGNEIHDHGVNWIGLKIDSAGGDLEDCLRLANSVAELDANEVQTVAYVPVDASDGAALVALGVRSIGDAAGGARRRQRAGRASRIARRWMRRQCRSANRWARATDHSWSLLAAIDRSGHRTVFVPQRQDGRRPLLHAEEAARAAGRR